MPSKQIFPDADGYLPQAHGDLLLVHGLKRRTDLNNRFAKAHGRSKKDDRDRESVAMLLVMPGEEEEKVWLHRDNFLWMKSIEQVKRECFDRNVSPFEKLRALAYLGVPVEELRGDVK